MKRAGRRELRQQLWTDKNLGELARDAQDAFDAMPTVELRSIVMAYTEPLVLGQIDEQPAGIEVIRIYREDDQERSVGTGGLCHFVWKPDAGGAFIKNIDGMSVGTNGGIRYRFNFRISYFAKGGS